MSESPATQPGYNTASCSVIVDFAVEDCEQKPQTHSLHAFFSSGKGFKYFFPVTFNHKSLLSSFVGEDDLRNIRKCNFCVA